MKDIGLSLLPKEPLPQVSDSKWPVNEIDYFVMNKTTRLG